MTAIPLFEDMKAAAPDMATLASRYQTLHEHFDAASTDADREGVLQEWEAIRRATNTWSSLVGLHFEQDTQNPEYKTALDYRNEISPKIEDLETAFKKKLLASPHRPALEQRFGRQAFALWECASRVFDPVIADDLVAESKTGNEYTALKAAAAINFRGETYNLSTVAKFTTDADRATREESNRVRWQWFADNAEKLDSIFDRLVKLRASMATKLGMKDYVEFGYSSMSRIDYDRKDVERLREEVRTRIVPLVLRIREMQRKELGLEKLMIWDAGVYDLRGNPKPKGDHDWMLDRAQEMFEDIGHGMGDFFRMLRDHHLLDLKSRDRKAGGGFCTNFATFGVPFIFANFNGTQHDAEVFTHEVGHAFQNFSSKHQPLSDYAWPTYESAEIHSMSLEYISWPWMDKFFGEDADRFRRTHLLQSICFLPYGVAVDHFQHMVYEKPDATPAQRHEMWKECERLYLPDREYGDMPHVKDGGFWQAQNHIYSAPFYYIDYVIAGICALQFWVRVEEDRDLAMKDYVALCKRGGEAPFQELATSAGLTSPFVEGCLAGVADKAMAWLKL